MALNKRLMGVGAADANLPSEYFNTVLYTGNGGTQRVGGYINRGGVFNGSSSSLDIESLDLIQNQIESFSFWFRGKFVFGFYDPSSASSSDRRRWFIDNTTTGSIKIQVNNDQYNYEQTGITEDSNWHHLAVVSDGKIYLDGTQLTTTFNTSYWITDGTNGTSRDTIRIGTSDFIGAANSSYSAGSYDQIRLFDKAISSSEVTTLYGETHASTTISTTDIFNDESGIALYQLDGNANDTGGVNGKFGAAAIFNGSSSYIDLPSGVRQNNNFTFSFWFNTNSTTLGQNAVAFRDGKKFEIRLNDSNIGNGSIRVNAGNNTDVDSATGIFSANTWHYLAVTQSSTGGVKVYLDGSVVASNSGATGDLVSVSGKDLLGARYSTSYINFFNGKIDDVRMYSDVLTSTEVGYLYNNTAASIPTDNLEAYYKLDGNALDSANSFDGTESNIAYGFDGTASNVVYQEATNFTPDLVWIKNRDTTNNHAIYDSIRGNYFLQSSTSNQEQTSAANTLSSFDTNGFTVSGGGNAINGSSYDYAAWCFNAGTEAAASNTNGTIESTVKANQDAGFSIIKYTGDGNSSSTFGHGLSQPPDLYIHKDINNDGNDPLWGVYHVPTDKKVFLNLTNLGADATSGGSNGTLGTNKATSTTLGFNAGSSSVNNVNSSGADYLVYAFHSVDGIQKVGSYSGTGVIGNLVDTGFEPAFVMIKRTDFADNWIIFDNDRITALFPNLPSQELSGYNNFIKFASNGFIVNTTDNSLNNSSGTYIYLAIAADPDTTTPVVENSFDVVTYTGRSNVGTVDVETGFKPDLVWIKSRAVGHHNYIVDSIRGANKVISSNLTTGDPAFTPDEFTSFNDDGFTVNFTSGGGRTAYSNDGPYVAWCWKAGDHDDNLPQINTEGTIDSVVSVNDAAGFSIVKWTGDGVSSSTVGHGLSSLPEMIIAKSISEVNDWNVNHVGIPNKIIYLHSTNAAFSGGGTNGAFGYQSTNTATTFQFTAGSSGVNNVNKSGQQYIAYCFTSITGYQSVGSYTGNGSATGPIVTTGFEPRFLVIKRTDASGYGWYMMDSARGMEGTSGKFLFANTGDNEGTLGAGGLQPNSNGFQITDSGAGFNANEGTYIYLAIK